MKSSLCYLHWTYREISDSITHLMPAPKSYRRRKSLSRRTARRPLRLLRIPSQITYFVEKHTVVGTNGRTSGDLIKKFVNGTMVAKKFVSTADIKKAFKLYVARQRGGFWPFASKDAPAGTPAPPTAADPATPPTVYMEDKTSTGTTIKQYAIGAAAWFGVSSILESFFNN